MVEPMLRHLIAFLVLPAAIAACSGDDGPASTTSSPTRTETAPREPPAAAPSPLPSAPLGVYPLRGLDPMLPDDDLDAATRILDGADIIAFGETVHASEGYAEARVRAIRYLVEKKGVRAIAFESPWGAAETTRAFVERCEGTIAAARYGLTFRAWMSRATSGLLEWLCAYNEAHTDDRVTVFGFDVQDPSFDGRYVRTFFAKTAPAQAALAVALDACVGAKFDTTDAALADPVEGPILRMEQPVPPARHTACLDAASAASAYMTANAAALEASSSHEETELARFAVRAIKGNEGIYFHGWNDLRKSFESRDEGMADGFVVLRALRAPGKRVAIVAHNEHIMRKRDVLVTDGYDWKSMGSFLAERLGEKYAPVGLFAYRVRINWDGSKVEDLPLRNGTNDLERPPHELGISPLVVDLADNALYERKKAYAITEVERGVPLDHFRALLFLEESPPFADP